MCVQNHICRQKFRRDTKRYVSQVRQKLSGDVDDQSGALVCTAWVVSTGVPCLFSLRACLRMSPRTRRAVGVTRINTNGQVPLHAATRQRCSGIPQSGARGCPEPSLAQLEEN